MGLLNLSVKDAVNDIQNKFLNPFKPKITPEEVKSAHSRNDFKDGLRIAELVDGTFNEDRADTVKLKGDAMPHIPFAFGGTQKLVKDFYPGNSEPTVQVLGPRESDLTIRGRLKAKNIKTPAVRTGINLGAVGNFATGLAGKFPLVPDISPAADNEGKQKREELRTYPQEVQQLMDSMRIRGNLIRITMGEFQRFGFLEETAFSMKTIADIEYELRFSIIGFNPPSDCRILSGAKTVHVAINKKLIAEVAKFKELSNSIPVSVPRGIGDQLNDLISTVAESVSLVTGFVDTALNEVDDVKSSALRAIGLVKNARNQLSTFQRRFGAIDTFATTSISAGNGIADGYNNASYMQGALSSSFSLTALLETLRAQIAGISDSEPIARHLVKDGDTLQKIALKFYKDSSQWKEIYDHNKLTSTELVRGKILEIPRI